MGEKGRGAPETENQNKMTETKRETKREKRKETEAAPRPPKAGRAVKAKPSNRDQGRALKRSRKPRL